MAGQITAIQAFQMVKSGIASLIKDVETLSKEGGITPITKKLLDSRKSGDLKAFVEKYKIAVVETVDRVGGSRGGVVATSTELAKGNENHPLVHLAKQYVDVGTKFQAELKKVNRSLSPGYIRAEEKPKNGEATGTEATAPANAAGKTAAPAKK